MVVNKMWLLPLFVVVVVIFFASSIVINPWFFLVASCALMVLLVLFLTKKNDTLRIVSLTIITTLVSFNFLQKTIGIIILGCLIAAYLFSYLIDKDYRNVRMGKSELFFIGWIAYTLFQTIWTVTTGQTWLYVAVLIFGVTLIWFMVRIISTKDWLIELYKWWGIALLGTLIVGWWEVTTNNHFPGSGAGNSFYNLQNAATAGFFNPNDYSFFLVISLPIIYHWIEKNGLYRLLGLFMLISAFYIIYLNGARFITLLFILSTAGFLISLARNRKMLFTFFVVAITVVCFYNYDIIVQAIGETFSLSRTDESVGIRNLLLLSGLSIFIDHPLGVGSGNLEYYMMQKGLAVNGITAAHNFWLEILVQYGIFVFLGLVVFFVVSLYRMRKAVRTTESLRYSITPMLRVVVLFVPACIEASTIFTLNITWFLFGAMICAVNLIKKETKVKSKASLSKTAQV